MDSSDLSHHLHEVLPQWYDYSGRDLPMRSPSVSAWGTLVFEVMSQQTPIPRVEPIWLAWMDRWPTPADLAQASGADILVAWDRLGYPSRALRLRDCAHAVLTAHAGRLPSTVEELLTLPGVGPYTASAVASFHFRQRVPVLDTNIRRVFTRILTGTELPSPGAPSTAEVQTAWDLLPLEGDEAASWNVSVMEFGALVCTARKPLCDECPITDLCEWRAAGYPQTPGKRKTQAWAGTDRQARGRVMALLRSRHAHTDPAHEGTGHEGTGRMDRGTPHEHTDSPRNKTTTPREDTATPRKEAPDTSTSRRLRSPASATEAELLAAATLPNAAHDQAPRVIAGLLTDGLIIRHSDGTFTLP